MDLYNLTKLTLSYNSLTSLPPELGALSDLTKLWLGYNALTSLPPELGALSSLALLQLFDQRSSRIGGPLQPSQTQPSTTTF